MRFDYKILNRDELVEAEPPHEVIAFQGMLCGVCRNENAGECVKDDSECPIATVTRAYKRGG